MLRHSAFVIPLEEIEKDDEFYVGHHVTEIAEMLNSKLPVAPGFIITQSSYDAFLEYNQLHTRIDRLLTTMNRDLPESVEQVYKHIRDLIISSPFPNMLQREIEDSLRKLNSEKVSLTYHREMFIDTGGIDEILTKIKFFWASFFVPNKIGKINNRTIIVQKALFADMIGTISTIDPIAGDKNKIIIQTSQPFGHYELNKKSLKPISEKASAELKDEELKSLGALAKKVEQYFYFPQIFEWVKDRDTFYITRVRPVTHKTEYVIEDAPSILDSVVLSGMPIFSGIATGSVKKISKPSEAWGVKKGDVVVVKHLEPYHLPYIKNASAIISESNAAVFRKSLAGFPVQIPIIVEARGAHKNLSSKQVVTVNGKTGEIHKGGYYQIKKRI